MSACLVLDSVLRNRSIQLAGTTADPHVKNEKSEAKKAKEQRPYRDTQTASMLGHIAGYGGGQTVRQAGHRLGITVLGGPHSSSSLISLSLPW